MKKEPESAINRASVGLCGLVLGTILLVVSCAPHPAGVTHGQDGKIHGRTADAFFRHRWWNYYARGLSYAEEGCHEEALADLRKAAAQRERDQRMARTYGMHFIDYFPHRETGILLYETGDLDGAQHELELSLESFPTAKARYYIDQIRKKRIQQSRIDAAPPEIAFAVATGEIATRDDPVVVNGTAASDLYIARLTINSEHWFQEGARQKIAFSKALELTQGRHEITVLASDLGGRTAARSLVVTVDRQGPLISLDRLSGPSLQEPGAVEVQGVLYDETGVDRLEIDGRGVAIGRGKEVAFSLIVKPEGRGIDVTATDLLGNRTTARLDPRFFTTGPPAPVLLAALESDGPLPAAAGKIQAGDGRPQRETERDRRPPVIALKGWTRTQTVYMPKIYLEGQVRDDGGVTAVTVNGQPVLKGEGRHIIFSWFFELKEGENGIRIEAHDASGNTAVEDILVERRIPEAVQFAARHKATLLPFDERGAITDAGALFQDRLIDAFVSQNRFQVVERNLLDLILQEQKLSRSQLVEESTALEIGRLAAAHSIVAGSIVATRNGVEVVSRLIDTETSEVLATEDAFEEVGDNFDLGALAEAIAIKYHRDFQLVDGLVIDKNGSVILTDLGAEQVRKQRRILVYREQEVRHPLTGRILGADKKIICRARFTQIDADFSRAELTGGATSEVQVLHKVITE